VIITRPFDALDASLNDGDVSPLDNPRSGRLFSGAGRPADIIGLMGWLFIDTTTGDLWQKVAPYGANSWVLACTVDATAREMRYVFYGRPNDHVGDVGSFCLVVSALDSCSLDDADVVGPKLPSAESYGTWFGATSIKLKSATI